MSYEPEFEAERIADKYFYPESFHHNLADDIVNALFSPERVEGRHSIARLDKEHDRHQIELALADDRKKSYETSREVLASHLGAPSTPAQSERSKKRAEKSTRRAMRHPNAKFL